MSGELRHAPSTASATTPGVIPMPPTSFGPTWIWVLQALVFLGGGPAFLVPSLSFPLFLAHPLPTTAPLRIPYDGFALLGVHATSVGLVTLFALVVVDPVARRALARVSVVFLGFWIATLLWNLLETGWPWEPDAVYGDAALGLLAVASTCLLGNLVWAFRKLDAQKRAIGFGHVASAPSWTWPAWLVTAGVAGASGAFFFFAPDTALRHAVRTLPSETAVLAWEQVRFAGAYAITYGALALVIATSDRESVWRPLAKIAAGWAIATVIVGLIRFDPTHYTAWGYGALALAGVVGAVALGAALSPAIPWAEDVSRRRDGWALEDLAAGPMMGVQVLQTKRRASHLVGIGAQGVLRVSDDPSRPENTFFVPGAELRLVARFANLTELDDAALDVRGGAISVVSQGGERFDMVMNTGSAAPIRNVVQFAGFVGSKFLPTFGSELVVKSSRLAREGGIVGLRRSPSSFTRLYFHSQIVRWWMTPAGAMHLVRYRLAPEDLGEESGLPDADDCTHIWDRKRRPDFEGGPAYLREELRDRLEKGPVRFRFQMQHRPTEPELDLPWYDASVDWPVDDLPWRDIGIVELDASLPFAETERLGMNPWNHPPSFGVPPSTGLFDLRSLGDSEVRVMAMLQRLRTWMYRAFGLPKDLR